MEQILVSDEELLKRINKVVKESKEEGKPFSAAGNRQKQPSIENFHDVSDTLELPKTDVIDTSEVKICSVQKNLVLENQYLAQQLEEEKKRSRELQTKFKLFENSVKYFERLNGQLETIKKAIDCDDLESDKEDSDHHPSSEAMQKIKPKNIHTAASGSMDDHVNKETANFSEPNNKELNHADEKEEVAFRDAEDFKQLEQGLEIVKDKSLDRDPEVEKVFITKTEKRCLEDIGNIAARTRTPLDEKHQKYFEKDRRKFANSIVMPEIQEVDKAESVPLDIISKTKETPVNITSTELDGLRSYLIQLKELIARRETAWARTTERDYNQRVEITRFKNEVSHLRMLCEKRQKDLKERDQVIAAKDEEIRELQKRIQGLRNAIMKLEKKDDRLMDTIDGITNEVLENSQIVQRSYNAMKRQSLMTRVGATGNLNPMMKQPANITLPTSKHKELGDRRKFLTDKTSLKKIKQSESMSNVDESKIFGEKKSKSSSKSKTRHKIESPNKPKDPFDRVDEKLQRVEEMLHSEVLKGIKKSHTGVKMGKNQTEIKSLMRNQLSEKNMSEIGSLKRSTPSNSKVRQEMLAAMTGMNLTPNMGLRHGVFLDPKKNNATAAVIANALLAARNANIFN